MPSVMLRITVRYSTCCVVCRGGPSTIVTALCPRVTPLNTSDRTHARPHTVSSPIHSRHPAKPKSMPSSGVLLFNYFQFSSVQFLPRSTSQSAESDSEAESAPARRAGGPSQAAVLEQPSAARYYGTGQLPHRCRTALRRWCSLSPPFRLPGYLEGSRDGRRRYLSGEHHRSRASWGSVQPG